MSVREGFAQLLSEIMPKGHMTFDFQQKSIILTVCTLIDHRETALNKTLCILKAAGVVFHFSTLLMQGRYVF